MCANDGHHKAHTSYFPHCLPSPTHTETVSLSGCKLIWFNSKGKPATGEKTVSREKAKLCKILHWLQIWGEKIVWWKKKKKKKTKGGGECVDHDRYEKWVAGWAINDQTFWCGKSVRTCAHVCISVWGAAFKPKLNLLFVPRYCLNMVPLSYIIGPQSDIGTCSSVVSRPLMILSPHKRA